LNLLILELLLFEGFLSSFDLAGQNPSKSAGKSRQNHYLSLGRRVLAVRRQNSSGGFFVY
jgi:hypothetical protein